MDLSYILNDYRLLERTTPNTDVNIYLEEYMLDIEVKLKNMENLSEKIGDRKAYNPELEVSPNRIKLTRNIIETLQTFPREHYFYKPAKKIPKEICPYLIEVLFTTINTLTVSSVIKTIKSTRGRDSIFIQYYKYVKSFHTQIILNLKNITFTYGGVSYTIGMSGMTFQDYIEDTRTKDTVNVDTVLNLMTKTNIGEGTGSSYFMRNFRIPSNQFKNAILETPNGKTSFPDFILDTNKISRDVKDYIFSTLNLPESRYLFIDTKAPIPENSSKGTGNERGRYPRAKSIIDTFIEIDAIKNREDLFNNLLPSEYAPIILSPYQFKEVLRYWFDEKDRFINEQDPINILFQNIGVNTSTQPEYYVVDFDLNKDLIISKKSDSLYLIIQDNKKLARFTFYPNTIYNKLKNKEAMLSDLDLQDDKGNFSKNKAIRKYTPIEDWFFMLQWDTQSLRVVNIPEYVPTFQRKL